MATLIMTLLRALHREDVVECAIATGRFPAQRIGAAWQALSQTPLTTDEILLTLVGAGGARHVDALGQGASSWSFRSSGLGVVTVTATRKGDDDVRARFVLTTREEKGREEKPAREEKPKKSIPPRKSARPKRASLAPDAMPKEALAPKPVPTLDVGPRAFELDTSATAPLELDTAPRSVELATDSATGLVDLLRRARSMGASDLHLVAGRPPLFRVAGDLSPRGNALDDEAVRALVSPAIPERLREALEKEGACDFAYDDPQAGRARVNVARQRTGLLACFRLIPREVPSLESLGLPDEIARATRHHQGLIVVTGPTGHGKTTTLAAIVDRINRDHGHHVLTIEDPVEFVHVRNKALLSQREVGTHTKSFRAALKGALREDPDVIVVGELRDLETVAMALSASETGHLVLGTMNTPSAAKAIDRLIDLFPPGDQEQVRTTLAGGLKLVVGQRLVPSTDRTRMHAAVELLTGTVALWNLIRDKKTYQIPSLQQRGRALGIIRLDDSLAELVRGGKIAREEALAVAESPETLSTLLGGGAARVAPEPPKESGNLLQRAGAIFGKKGG